MKEKIYTIAVNDAFNDDCECPICSMYTKLENDAVEYSMGPSYMEDDIREQTDKLGFCKRHIKQVYDMNNRLGFALVMKTHMDRVIKDVEQYSSDAGSGKKFLKKGKEAGVCGYIDNLEESCFVCNRINQTFERYIDTVIYMYRHDSEFKKKYEGCKGFCTSHYKSLMRKASNTLSGSEYEDFAKITTDVYLDNMKRVRDDVEWFIDKFDHRNADKPWKNAKDSLPRAITKNNSLL
ncbi:MAG: DUF6062 family protein [Lachnospira sp.]